MEASKLTHEQKSIAVDIARADAATRTEDPLKNWTRPDRDECPICLLPFPVRSLDDPTETLYKPCCGTTACLGCCLDQFEAHAGGNETKAQICPFCRAVNDKETDKCFLEKFMKLARAGRSEAAFYMAGYYYEGGYGLTQDKAEGLSWYTRAAEAGHAEANFDLGMIYDTGDGVIQDSEKAFDYYRKAAELGYVAAFVKVAQVHFARGDLVGAILNIRKAAMCGLIDDYVSDNLRKYYQSGMMTKDEYAYTLREQYAAAEEMKSEGREKFKRFREREAAKGNNI